MRGVSFVVAVEAMTERALRIVVGLAAGFEPYKGERWRIQLYDNFAHSYPIPVRGHDRLMTKGLPMPKRSRGAAAQLASDA